MLRDAGCLQLSFMHVSPLSSTTRKRLYQHNIGTIASTRRIIF